MGSLRLVAILLLLGSPAFAQSPTYGVGRTPTADEIRRMDISIGPTGEELPPGRGTAKEGALVFEQKGCVACHGAAGLGGRSEEHTSELQSRGHLVCRLLLEKKKKEKKNEKNTKKKKKKQK